MKSEVANLVLTTSFDEVKALIKTFTDDDLDVLQHCWFGKEGVDLINALHVSNFSGFERGVRSGWWKDWDENGPIPLTPVFKLSDFPPGATTAHLTHKLGMFPSINQARKNGFDEPLTIGSFSFKKGKLTAKVI